MVIDGDCYCNLQNTVQIKSIQSHLRLKLLWIIEWKLQFNRNTGRHFMAGDSS